jgi:8-oxo-dGTP pyrophosphatase MutT (NUDIX family)
VGRTRRTRRPPIILAAGGVVWLEANGVLAVAVIHRPKYDDWSLPKGKLDRGEDFRRAALREVEEETGCRARLVRFAGTSVYRVGLRPKLVLYWHMSVEASRPFEPNGEVDRLEWLPPRDALARLAHPGERRILRRSLEVGPTALAR